MTCKVLCAVTVLFAFVIAKVEELNMKDLDGIAKSSGLNFVLFVDKMDGPGEKALIELTDAEEKTRQAFPGASFTVGYLAQKLTDEQALYLKVMRSPLLRAYQGNGAYQNYDGRFLRLQVGAFLKRQLQLRSKKVSSLLQDQGHFGLVIHELDPVVIFCGKESDPEFSVFESIAKGSKYLYYHSFSQELCTNLNLMRVDKIRDLRSPHLIEHTLTEAEKTEWLKKNEADAIDQFKKGKLSYDEMQKKIHESNPPEKVKQQIMRLNDTLLNMYKVSSPSLFVVMKHNKVFEIIPAASTANQMRVDIDRAAVVNFYTDSEKMYDHIRQSQPHTDRWLAFFSDDAKLLQNEVCQAISTLASASKLTDPHQKFACLNSSTVQRFHLDQPLMTGENALYYFRYSNGSTKEEKDFRNPLKFRKLSPSADEIERFLDSCSRGNEEPFYFSARTPEPQLDVKVVNLTANTYKEWKEDYLGTHHLVVFSIRGEQPKYLKLLEEFAEFLAPLTDIKLGRVDVYFNQVPELEDEDAVNMLVYPKSSRRSVKIRNVDLLISMKTSLAKLLPDVNRLLQKELDPEDPDL